LLVRYGTSKRGNRDGIWETPGAPQEGSLDAARPSTGRDSATTRYPARGFRIPQELMHDFMQSHHDTAASTESFKAVAEKHITKEMDLLRNGSLDWFFREWVYGTEVPRYTFKYEVQAADAGHIKIHTELTQSEVDQNFAMLVPIFADFGSGMVRLGQLPIVGNSTRQANFILDRQPKKVAINAYKEILER
jgi:hypothetical protein